MCHTHIVHIFILCLWSSVGRALENITVTALILKYVTLQPVSRCYLKILVINGMKGV